MERDKWVTAFINHVSNSIMPWVLVYATCAIMIMKVVTVRERFHQTLELERIQGRRVGRIKKNKPYSCAYTQLDDKKMMSILASDSSSPCNSIFQGGHAGREAGPSSPVPTCYGNVFLAF
jgi:hypothetical protein